MRAEFSDECEGHGFICQRGQIGSRSTSPPAAAQLYIFTTSFPVSKGHVPQCQCAIFVALAAHRQAPPHEMNLHSCASLQRVVHTELVIFSSSFELLQAVVEVGEMTDDQARDDVLSVLKQM